MTSKLKMFFRRIGVMLGLFLLTFCSVFFDEIMYGFTQWRGQVNIVNGAKELEVYLNDASYPDSLKEKIRLVREIRKFAIDSLGIYDSDNYKKVYDQHGEAVLWNVEVCPPYSMDAYRWSYPFAGSFPYRGRFDYETALLERDYYQEKGYDVRLREVAAWSTLGYFEDPILSNVLYRPEGALAEIIIHEMTHRTIFVYDDVTYNENLATFIGEQGAVKFLKYRYGADSPELKQYLALHHDHTLKGDYILRGAQLLDTLYRSFGSGDIEGDKKHRKYVLIGEVVKNLDTLKFESSLYQQAVHFDTLPNNTFFAGYLRYRSLQDSIRNDFYHRFEGDFQKYFEHLKHEYPLL